MLGENVQAVADRLASILAARVMFLSTSDSVEHGHVEANDLDGLENLIIDVADMIRREGKKLAPFKPKPVSGLPEWRGKCGDTEIRLLFLMTSMSHWWRVDVCYA